MTKGYFIPVFHAYIPLGLEGTIEERYLFEYLADTFYPLVRVFEGLENEAIPYGFTLSLSPVLAGMLDNPSLMLRFGDYLLWRIKVAQKLLENESGVQRELGEFYYNRYKDIYYWHAERYHYRPLKAIFNLASLGNLEVIFSCGGNGVLPFLEGVESSAAAEVRAACSEYKSFSEGAELAGIWLTELAFSAGNEEILANENLRYFFVDKSAMTAPGMQVINGVARPVLTDNGVVAFGINSRISKKVALMEDAYYLDGTYLQKIKDYAEELPEEDFPHNLFPFAGQGINTGIGLVRRDYGAYSVKEAYDRADVHAEHYLGMLHREVQRSGVDGCSLVLALDHEEEGHGWFELAWFMDLLLRKMAFDQDEVSAVTPQGYLAQENEFQVVALADSSVFADSVFSEFYRNEREKYLPEVHLANLRLAALAGENEEVLGQMAKELMLASGCEWSYYCRRGIESEYIKDRQRRHLARFAACEDMLKQGIIDYDVLRTLQERTPVLNTVTAATYS